MYNKIIVSAEYLAALEKDARMLRRLQDAGVSNWDGYEFALKDLDE